MYLTFANLLGFVISVHGLVDFSHFRTTKVLTDNCSRTEALSVFDSSSIFTCASECTANTDCRRFMTRPLQGRVECSLYYEGENCAYRQPADCSCFMKTFGHLNGTTVCPIGLYGDNCEHVVKDCSEGNEYEWSLPSSTYTYVRSYIKPLFSTIQFEVACTFNHGGAILFMSRNTRFQKVSFNRNLTEYVDGFGDANGDHWLGITRMKEILDNHPRNKLSAVFFNNSYCENYYNNFTIGWAVGGYPINLGDYEIWPTQKCGDSLTGAVNIEGSPFSAPSSDQTSFNCADNRQGGWWYANDSRCSESYFMGSRDAMLQSTSLGNTPQEFVGLLIRPYS